jgi:hypothetical protein
MRKVIKYTWAVLKALITLAIALECLLIADSTVFEVLVALLILIYLQNMAGESFAKVMYQDLARMSKHLRQIRARLDVPHEEEEEELSASEQIMVKLEENAFQEFILLIQLSIMYMMVLFFLVKTVLKTVLS